MTGQITLHSHLANLATSKYNHPDWQNIALFPWMQDETLKLSEVYTSMEMVEYLGRYHKKVAVPMRDYTELFKNMKPEGTRILVTGDPGIGKTTFVHKLAYDWVMGNLDMFDVVLVVKLKYATKTQSIASMVEDQIGPICDSILSPEEAVGQFMKSGRDRILLVLDGIDEIKLEEYKQVEEVLRGDAYRKCCILATTRPYVAETLKNKMTMVSKIKGFSRTKAEEFISHILKDKEEREKFFQQIDRRKMSKMEKVPIVIQALALLYRENKQLPSTYTLTYDDLVLYLGNTYRSKFLDETFSSEDMVLSEEEIQEAMKEVNELAFKGLTREDRQLVFLRDEIKNENVFKLGLLSGEKTGSGFRPTAVLQFVHKTVQEHSASDHVVKRFLSDDRGPWEALVEQFHKDATTLEEELPNRQRRAKPTTTLPTDAETDDLSRKNTMVASALKKIVRTALSRSRIEEEAMDFCRKLVDAGAFEDEIDFTRVSDVLTSHPITNEIMTEEEKTALVNYLVKELLMETPKEWRAHEKSWLEVLLRKSKTEPNEFKKYLIDQKKVLTWIANNPQMAKQALLQLATFFKILHTNPDLETEYPFGQPYQYIAQEFTELLERVEYNKTLFRFIIGKLTDHPAERDVILQEMAVLVLQHSFDVDNGGVLPVNEMLSFVWDLKRESLPDDDNDNILQSEDPFLITPALVHLRSTMKFYQVDRLVPDTPCALKILGTEASIPEFIPKVIRDIKHLRNVHIVELESIDHPDQDQDLPGTYQEFSSVLYQSPNLVSLELNSLDPKLTGILTQNLPSSVKRLSVGTVPARRTRRGTYTFPSEVHFVCLQLHNCLYSLGDLFKKTSFPKLKKISIQNDSHEWEGKQPLIWRKEDAQSLLDAVRTGRMSVLEELNIRDCCLKGCGPELVEILKAESFCSADFVGAELNIEDGKIILKNIQDGNLDHVEFLSLMDNKEISPLTTDLKTACKQREITLEINASLKDTGSDVTSHLETVASGFIAEQAGNDVAQTMTSLISNFFQSQSGPTTQPENPTKSEAPGLPFDFSTIGNLVSTFLNSVRQPNPEEQKQNVGLSDGERKRDDYVDDLDLD